MVFLFPIDLISKLKTIVWGEKNANILVNAVYGYSKHPEHLRDLKKH